MEGQYNKRNPAVKRLMKEAQELSEATSEYFAQPLEDNLFEWHFTVRGPSDTEFEGGVYHGRIVLPTDYPMKPPNIIVLTPNGRFETGKKICLSISGHHPESWQPSWSIRTALLAIIGFMPTPGQGTIGSLDFSADERRLLAKRSNSFQCEQCGLTTRLLKTPAPPPSASPSEAASASAQETDASNSAAKTREEAEEIIKNLAFKSAEEDEAEAKKENDDDGAADTDKESATAQEREEEDKQQAEIRERKRASKAAQDRFRAKLMQRTGGFGSSTAAGAAANDPPSRAPAAAAAAAAARPVHGRQAADARRLDRDWSWSDLLIVTLVVAIAVIVYRRLNAIV